MTLEARDRLALDQEALGIGVVGNVADVFVETAAAQALRRPATLTP
jgi:hypothetical protein